MRIVMLAVVVLGCSKDVDVMAEYRPRLDKIVQQLAQLKPMLDKAPVEPIKDKPEPPLMLQKFGNTILIDFDDLTKPDTSVTSMWASDLTMALHWAKDTKKPSSSESTQRSMRNVLDAAVGTRYVVAVRYLDFEAPRLLDKDTFEPGSQTARVYLVDLEANKLLGGFEVKATTAEDVRFTYREEGGRSSAANAAIRDSIKADLRKQVEAGLSWLGTIEPR
jgi:hypothetical protein